MELPRYCIVGNRPVKVVTNDKGMMDIRAYQWDTGKFARDLSYLKAVIFCEDPDVEIVDLEQFKATTIALRQSLKASSR